MNFKSSLFLGLLFLAFAFIACNQDPLLHDYPMPPPSLAWITIPTEELPANSLLMVVSIPGMAVDSVTIRVSGVSGKVTAKLDGTLFLFEPASMLPLGKATVEVQGKALDGRDFAAINPPVLELEIIAPDLTPPTLIGTEPPDGWTAQFFNESDVLFVFSEPVNWFDAKVSFEPNVALNRENQPAEIQSQVSGFLSAREVSGRLRTCLKMPKWHT